jgi:hypothetical protein
LRLYQHEVDHGDHLVDDQRPRILSERKLRWALRKKQAIRHISPILGVAGMCRLALRGAVQSHVPDLSSLTSRSHALSQPPEVQEGRRASNLLIALAVANVQPQHAPTEAASRCTDVMASATRPCAPQSSVTGLHVQDG